ncbi:uncharacterized protein LOC110013021 [Sesamum indicum]|uniref:Uncharacterized protein LOC110013021 n=1 Tax=Sesamum indicum TaxID=4182 RepID=A0A8M8VD11_SESIN|nr:uncharacterized protein LOC110013021 [Sesamum indicum]
MPTSLLMAANDHQPTNPPPPQDHDHDLHPVRRSSGRRKPRGCDGSSAGSSQKKKQPQRGMGVEKLERLRMQERWKKMTEINTKNQGFTAPSFPDPALINASSVPVQISKLGGFAAPGVPQMGLSQNQSYLGFHGQMGVGGLASDQPHHHTDLFGIGCLNNSGFVGKNVSGISKELSSTPNAVNCYSEHCNACHKKKKVNGENWGGGRAVRSDMYTQMCNVGDCGFLGLNTGDNQNIINQDNHQGLGTKTLSVPHQVGNGKQGVEVVAVHMKGSGSGGWEGGNQVLMEYEFFPSAGAGKGGDEVVQQEGGSSSEASSGWMAGFDHASINCIDLSLKLSY